MSGPSLFIHCTSATTFTLLVCTAGELQITPSTTKDKPSKNSTAATKKQQGDPALPSALPRARKEAAQDSGQLQLYKVTQIFYLENAVKPILISSIFKNNPVVCCYLSYKKEESEKDKAVLKNQANRLHQGRKNQKTTKQQVEQTLSIKCCLPEDTKTQEKAVLTGHQAFFCKVS